MKVKIEKVIKDLSRMGIEIKPMRKTTNHTTVAELYVEAEEEKNRSWIWRSQNIEELTKKRDAAVSRISDLYKNLKGATAAQFDEILGEINVMAYHQQCIEVELSLKYNYNLKKEKDGH